MYVPPRFGNGSFFFFRAGGGGGGGGGGRWSGPSLRTGFM